MAHPLLLLSRVEGKREVEMKVDRESERVLGPGLSPPNIKGLTLNDSAGLSAEKWKASGNIQQGL